MVPVSGARQLIASGALGTHRGPVRAGRGPDRGAINGPAIGAGLERALARDVRIAGESAVFAMPQMQMGIVPDVGGTSRLARAAGEAFAKDLILTSRIVGAEEALRAGIVSRVVPDDQLPTELASIAAAIEALPWPSAYFATLAIDVGPRLDARRAADIEAVADQVMLREQAVWEPIAAFVSAKGISAAGSSDT